MKKRVAFMLLSSVSRLPVHYGALHGYYRLAAKGILPKPSLMVCSSAGSVAGSACISYTEENFQRVIDLLVNLKPSDIKEIPLSTKLEVALAGLSMMLPLVPLKQSLSKKKLFWFTLFEMAAAFGSIGVAIEHFMKRPYIFSNEPLRRLLINELPKDILDSPIRLEIVATDRGTGEHVFFSNHDENMTIPRLASTILASSRLSGLPLEVIDGKSFTDAAVGGDMPLHRAVDYGCDAIVVFQYTPDQELSSHEAKDWVVDISHDSRISRSSIRHLTLHNYLLQRKKDPSLPPVFILKSSRPLEDLDIDSFNKSNLSNGVSVGYDCILENERSLQEFLS